MKEAGIDLDGIVSEILPSAMFRVDLDNGHRVLATTAGKMRKFRIRILAGDRVTVTVSPYDLTRGRITFRHKGSVAVTSRIALGRYGRGTLRPVSRTVVSWAWWEALWQAERDGFGRGTRCLAFG